MHIWNSETNENPRNPAQAETADTENQNLLKTRTLTLTEKRKQFKENFIEQTNLRWNLSYRLQTTKTRKSSRKPLRMTDSDRKEDDCLQKFSGIIHATVTSSASIYTRADLMQAACTSVGLEKKYSQEKK